MRRETSKVVVLVGEVGEGLLAGLGQSPNVSVARAPVAEGQESAGQRTPPRSGWERGALAMREAARRGATYVIVPVDPLAAVAAAGRAVWGLGGGGGRGRSRRQVRAQGVRGCTA